MNEHEIDIATDPIAQAVIAVIRDIMGRKAKFSLSDRLVADLHIDSDDLSFLFVPQLEKTLDVKIPPKEWSVVSTGLDACALLKKYSALKKGT